MMKLNSLLFLMLAATWSHAQDLTFLSDKLVDRLLAINSGAPRAEIAIEVLSNLNLLPGYEIDVDFVVCDVISANLDEQPGEEILCLVGASSDDTHFLVLKKQRNRWEIVFRTTVNDHYRTPLMLIADTPFKNKVFYVRKLYQRGTGNYQDGYEFFRFIDGVVYNCLNLPLKAHLYGWGMSLNQEAETDFSFSSVKDEVSVHLAYSFFPGPFDSQAPWDSNPDMPIVQDEVDIFFLWDPSTRSYIAQWPANLSEDKWKSIWSLGDDSKFISAFRTKLDELLSDTTSGSYDAAFVYFDNLSKNRPEFEETIQIGGTKFYKLRKKE